MPSAVRPSNYSRVSMLMQTNFVLNNIRTNSLDLLKAQDHLTSGLRISRPSDSPAEATTVMSLDSQLERMGQFIRNMDFAEDYMSNADNALGQAVGLLTEVHTLALEDTDDSGLTANAMIVNSIIDQLMTVSNTTSRGSHIFAGQNGTRLPFEATDNGIMFTGSLDEMETRVALQDQLAFSFDGNDIFGALSSQVLGIADLSPDITTATLLSDLNGAAGAGISRGSLRLNVDGTTDIVDLSTAVTVADVINKINASALNVTAALDANGTSLQITTTGADLKITEVGTGVTARDLGIVDSIGGDAIVLGQDVDARLTSATPVTALAGGAGIDTISGLNITNSAIGGAGPIDISTAQTLGDILRTINDAGLAVRASINSAGTGINIFNQLSGSRMSIGENGGTAATDLGIRSMVGTSALADLNGGKGVHVVGQDNLPGVIRITDRSGATYDVDLSTVTTIQDVMTGINAATGGAVTAGLTATGNGIELTDTTGLTAANLSVETISTNGYFVADELGLNQSVAAATLTGTDVNVAEPDGMFSHLIALRDAMLAGDRTEIFRLGGLIEADQTQLISFHGKVGAQMRALDDRKIKMEDNIIAMERIRSDIRDVDFAEAVTRFQSLSTALQANLQSAGMLTQTSLLDFL